MKLLAHIALWTLVIAVIPLPALSNSGYLPWMIEYLLYALACLLIGGTCALLTKLPYFCGALIFCATIFSVTLYYEPLLSQSMWRMVPSSLLAAAFLILCHRLPDKALILSAVAAFSQIATAAISTPGQNLGLSHWQVKHSDLFPVVHILLDEHTGLADIPPKIISPEEITTFEQEYVKRGFMVFTHAYTADKLTMTSIPHMFNKRTDSLSKLVGIDHFNGDIYMLRSSAFDEIGKERAIDITQAKYISFNYALAKNPAKERIYTYNSHNQIPYILGMSLYDRMIVATLVAEQWTLNGVKSPVARAINRLLHQRYLSTLISLGSHTAMQDFATRVGTGGERGTYYFSHNLLTHYPYIMDENCISRPLKFWPGKFRAQTGLTGSELFRRHFDQVLCSQRDVFNITDAMDKNPKMSDAVVLIHSDHGSRICLREDCSQDPKSYMENLTKKEWFNSFIALKIPGMQAQVIDTPVRLDTLYNNLLENHFKKIDLDKLNQQNDSPFN